MEYSYRMYEAGRGQRDWNSYPAGYHYQVWGPPGPWDAEREADRDMSYLQSMYPMQARMLQRLVEEECERQDYQGSPMYDEYPDQFLILRMCRRIREQAEQEGMKEEELTAEQLPREQRNREQRDREQSDRDQRDRDQRDRGRDDSLVDQLIRVLLFQEMHRRRRRKRDSRRWF